MDNRCHASCIEDFPYSCFLQFCCLSRWGFYFKSYKPSIYTGNNVWYPRDKNTGELSDTAKDILERFPSYTEISPSGTGLHIFYKGEMPAKGNKNTKTGVEMYAHSRYFTMTGERLPGTPDYIAEDNGALAWIHENYIKSKKRRGKSKKDRKNFKLEPLTDEEILEKARTAENHKEFDLLWEGKWQEAGYPSQSEADLALCCMLAFWSGKNKEQMDRLFRNSGLFREKWDTVHHASGATYGQETLDKAIEVTENVYNRESESVIFEHEGRYYRTRGESVYPITNFIIQPVEMIVSEDETQMTADLITIRDEIYRQTFMTTDFNNIQKFKNILNRRTISLGYFGSEGDLELLKGYISEMEWVRKTGVKALGIYEHGGRMVYVSTDGAIEAGGNIVEDIVQLDKYKSITTDILIFEPLTKEQLIMLGEWLLSYNEPIKTVSVMAWVAGCFIKPHLKKSGIKFPHLLLVGEQGSGKSNTLERVILPVFSCSKIRAATQVTAFTLMKESASSNLIPQLMDEFKPSKISLFPIFL
jgi:putative DNA primase/helicase